jgi:hypothetical protein
VGRLNSRVMNEDSEVDDGVPDEGGREIIMETVSFASSSLQILIGFLNKMGDHNH